MRLFLLLTISFLITNCSFEQDRKMVKKVTVILFDNQNPGLAHKVDTLMRAKQIDLDTAEIDLFFCNKYFKLPYYVPTEGIYRNIAKDKECNMENYPGRVKCFGYDNKNRVVKMTVNGSGTMNNFNYSYNDKNQITAITDNGSNYRISYNSDGTIAELINNSQQIEKRLVFIYN